MKRVVRDSVESFAPLGDVRLRSRDSDDRIVRCTLGQAPGEHPPITSVFASHPMLDLDRLSFSPAVHLDRGTDTFTIILVNA